MLGYFLENSDFGALAKLGPGNFLRAVRVSEVMTIAVLLRSNSKNEVEWRNALKRVKAVLQAGVRLEEKVATEDLVPANVNASVAVGELILQSYFVQLLVGSYWILDFRPTAWFQDKEKNIVWQPSRLFFTPDPKFQEGIRKLYVGYYENEEKEFRAGLKSLGLAPAEEVLRSHFGLGDQRSVQFELKDLQKTFGLVFEACAKKRSIIHPEFAAFGIGLLSLYQTLQESGLSYDVRAVFAKARKISEA